MLDSRRVSIPNRDFNELQLATRELLGARIVSIPNRDFNELQGAVLMFAISSICFNP